MQIAEVDCNMQTAFDAAEPANVDGTLLCEIPNTALLSTRLPLHACLASCAMKGKSALGSPVWGCFSSVPG